MKKLFLIFFVCMLATAVSAQSIRLFNNGQPLNDGDEVTMNYIPGETTHFYMEYANVSDENAFIKVRRDDVSFPSGDMLTFCVGGSCSQTLSGEFEVVAGDTITMADSSMVFHVDYTAAAPHVLGSSKIMFTFYNTEVDDDAVTFYLVVTPDVGVPQYEAMNLVSAYPNPATSVVNIHYRVPDSHAASLVVRNIVGSEVYRQEISGEGKALLSTSDMAPGIYVYGIEENGRLLNLKKLIVK